MRMLSLLFNVFAGFALLSSIMVIRAKNPVYSVLFLILVFCNASGLLLLLQLDFFAMVFLVVYVGAIAVLFLFVVMMLNIKLTEMNDTILRYAPVGGMFGVLFLAEIMLVLEHDLVPVMYVAVPNASFTLWGMYGVFFAWSLCVFCGVLVTHPWHLFLVGNQWYDAMQALHRTMHTHHTLCMPAAQDFHAIDYVLWPHMMEQTSTIHTLGHVMYTYYMALFLLASVILLIAMIGAIVLTMHKGVSVKRQDVYAQNTRDFAKTVHKITHMPRVPSVHATHTHDM